MDGNNYLDAVIPMDLPEGKMDKALNTADTQLVHSVDGSIGYMATAFRPKLSTDSSMLGRHFR